MTWKLTAAGVFRETEPVVTFSRRDVTRLRQEAVAHPNLRARLCAHVNDDDPVHEMLICLLQEGYVRPHAHSKDESLHIVEGSIDLVLFHENGEIARVLVCGTAPGEELFVRLPAGTFHTLLIRSEYVVFHETVRGPFRREHSTFANWAPSEQDRAAATVYLKCLEERLASFRAATGNQS